MSKCNMCLAGGTGTAWCKDILAGNKTYNQAATFFHMLPLDVMEHVNQHAITVDDATGVADSPDFYLRELLKVLKALKDWMEYCTTQANVSRGDIDLGIRLSKEVRETLKVLGEFQGRYNATKNPTVQLTEVHQKYMELTDVIMAEVCPKCQSKILHVIEKTGLPRITESTSQQ